MQERLEPTKQDDHVPLWQQELSICCRCEFAVWGDDDWGICLQSPPDRNNIAKFLPDVVCPIGRD